MQMGTGGREHAAPCLLDNEPKKSGSRSDAKPLSQKTTGSFPNKICNIAKQSNHKTDHLWLNGSLLRNVKSSKKRQKNVWLGVGGREQGVPAVQSQQLENGNFVSVQIQMGSHVNVYPKKTTQEDRRTSSSHANAAESFLKKKFRRIAFGLSSIL